MQNALALLCVYFLTANTNKCLENAWNACIDTCMSSLISSILVSRWLFPSITWYSFITLLINKVTQNQICLCLNMSSAGFIVCNYGLLSLKTLRIAVFYILISTNTRMHDYIWKQFEYSLFPNYKVSWKGSEWFRW